MGRFRPKMDATRALHTLGFSSGTGLIDISVEEIQNKFSLKMQQAHLQQQQAVLNMMNDSQGPGKGQRRHSVSNTDSSVVARRSRRGSELDSLDVRIIHEAFQFLILKKKKLSGRSLAESWNIVGGKATLMGLLNRVEERDQSGVESAQSREADDKRNTKQ